MRKLSLFIAGVVMATSAFAADLPKKKQTDLGLYVTATDAYEMKTADEKVFLIDVRTRAEVNFLGMPTVADANIPYFTPADWMTFDDKKQVFKLEPNADYMMALAEFLEENGGDKNSTILLMCRSGSRSAKAVNLMAKVGYKNVYSVTDGYEGDKSKEKETKGHRIVNGWKNSGLPWSYKLSRSKMYDL